MTAPAAAGLDLSQAFWQTSEELQFRLTKKGDTP